MPTPKRVARKPVAKRKPATKKAVAKRPAARGKPGFAPGGVASRLELRSQQVPITQRRPTVKVSKEQGFNVRTRKIGPKGKKIII